MLAGSDSHRALLDVRDLSVTYGGSAESRPVVDRLSFSIAEGEVVGMQGRSGCGKTSTALALLKLLPAHAKIDGSVLFRGRNLLTLSGAELRKVRGREISIVYQEPGLALNPVMRVGDQIAEVLRAHVSSTAVERKGRVSAMLERVRLNPARFYGCYPHELSGGERRRVLLAQALICGPSLVIADEPTAGLDPGLKNEVLDLIENLHRETGAAFLLVSHDRGVMERLAQRVIEMADISEPPHVDRSRCRTSLPTCVPEVRSHHGPSLIRVRNLTKTYESRGLFRRKSAEKRALDGVDLAIPAASIVGLIGASGSGKSTLARCLALLEQPDSGEFMLDNENLVALPNKELRRHRPRLQYIAQDAAEALNPRLTAGEAVEEPLVIQRALSKDERRRRADEALRQVGLDPASADRFCHEFSGGQKQRLVIARSLTLEPKLLIFDESLSGLDSGTQREIVELIGALKTQLGISHLLISHDLELVAGNADSIAVMREGRIIEQAAANEVIDNPEHWSTEHLLQPAARQELVTAEAE